MIILRLIFLITLFLVFEINAELVFGTGMTSVTGGRVRPLFNTAYDSSSVVLSFSSVGIKTTAYYHSGYNLIGAVQKDVGKYAWGLFRAGIGGGIHYAERGLDDSGGVESKSDFALGPAIRVTWEIMPFTVLGLESIYGIRNLNALLLSTQNIHSLILGVRF